MEEVALEFLETSKVEGSGLVLRWANELSSAPAKDSVEISVVFDGGSQFKAYESYITKSGYIPVW